VAKERAVDESASSGSKKAGEESRTVDKKHREIGQKLFARGEDGKFVAVPEETISEELKNCWAPV